MVTQPTPTGKPPWQERQLPSFMKLPIVCFMIILAIVATISGIGFAGVVSRFFTGGPGVAPSPSVEITISVVFLGSLGGLIALWPLSRLASGFTPSYGPIPAAAAGMPFEVRFSHSGLGRSLIGRGSIRFDADALRVSGVLSPSPLLQISVIVALTVVPLLLFSFGLGIFPALLIAYYVGRRRLDLTLPYQSLGALRVKGARLSLAAPGTPRRITLRVSPVDGERLYRELMLRYPAEIG